MRAPHLFLSLGSLRALSLSNGLLPRICVCLAALGFAGLSADEPVATVVPAAPTPTLAELEARLAAPQEFADQKKLLAYLADVTALAGSNTLTTAEEFHRAAKLAVLDNNEYRMARIRYELLLAAVAKDRGEAEADLLPAWNNLLRVLARPMRTDYRGYAALNPGVFTVEAAPACIAAVWQDPAAARTAAATAQSNAEVKSIVDADQAARQNWTNRTPEERQATMEADRARNVRMREIIAAGGLHTAADYFNAALVMQHSAGFPGYQLAHELAVCSLLLGDRASGRWLSTASYDRMLRSVGHDQRFGTQQTMAGPPLRVDEEGISDHVRQALGILPLAALRSTDRPTLAKFIKEVTGPDNAFQDEKLKIYGTLPGGWRISGGQRTGETLNVIFTIPGTTKTKPTLYFRLNPPTVPKAGGDPEAFLRAEAAKKAKDRAASYPDYANQADSLTFRRISGQPALSWIANYTDNGVPSTEYMIRVRVPGSVLFLFMSGPTEEVTAARAALAAFADTLRLPWQVQPSAIGTQP